MIGKLVHHQKVEEDTPARQSIIDPKAVMQRADFERGPG
jgi:hypothetical protein